MEELHQALEPDWSQHFADRLSGPDGMELVVEVAHDLRSPLTSILFLAETLQRARSGPINAVQERQLGLIYSAAFGLSSLASDVIELARGGDRLVDLDPLPFSVADIFESVRDIVQPIAEEKGLQVRLQMPTDDFRVGYPVALSRVLLNLTTNALKFTADGYVEVRGRAPRRHPGGVLGSRHRTGYPAARDAHPVRGLSPAAEAGGVRLLRRRARAVDLPQAGRGDAVHAAGRDRRRNRAPGSSSSWTCRWRPTGSEGTLPGSRPGPRPYPQVASAHTFPAL